MEKDTVYYIKLDIAKIEVIERFKMSDMRPIHSPRDTADMIDSNHSHQFACSIMLQLGSRAPIVIKWPAVVLVFWPHFNGNAQRRPRSASLGLALFSSRLCCFLCTSHGYPRGKSNRPRGCQKI